MCTTLAKSRACGRVSYPFYPLAIKAWAIEPPRHPRAELCSFQDRLVQNFLAYRCRERAGASLAARPLFFLGKKAHCFLPVREVLAGHYVVTYEQPYGRACESLIETRRAGTFARTAGRCRPISFHFYRKWLFLRLFLPSRLPLIPI